METLKIAFSFKIKPDKKQREQRNHLPKGLAKGSWGGDVLCLVRLSPSLKLYCQT